MGERIRAKFVVDSITRSEYGDGQQQTIRLSAVTDGSEENREFFAFTPAGVIELQTVNPSIAFEEGAEYYIDFVKATAAEGVAAASR